MCMCVLGAFFMQLPLGVMGVIFFSKVGQPVCIALLGFQPICPPAPSL